ncbi:MAG: hypothetical protein ACHQM6_09105, partial [Candidatus Kapaibacterium sp.]
MRRPYLIITALFLFLWEGCSYLTDLEITPEAHRESFLGVMTVKREGTFVKRSEDNWLLRIDTLGRIDTLAHLDHSLDHSIIYIICDTVLFYIPQDR